MNKVCGTCADWEINTEFTSGKVGRCGNLGNEYPHYTFYAEEDCKITAWNPKGEPDEDD